MPQIKDSLYEQLNPLTTVAGQHLVEDFSGDTLDTFRWTYTLLNGIATGSMSDSVDGGFDHTSTETGATSESITTFGNVNQFNHLGASFICVAKWSGDFPSTSMMQRGGFKKENTDSFNAGDHAGFAKPTAAPYRFQCYSASDTGGVVGTDTGISSTSADTPHVFKGELKSASFDLSIDGIYGATNTTNLPTVALQQYLYSWAYQVSAGSMTANFIYYEAWNT